jgi:hypothetical protein
MANRAEVPTVTALEHLITKKGRGVKVKLHAFWVALHGFDCQLHPSCRDEVDWVTSSTIMHREQSAPSNNNNKLYKAIPLQAWTSPEGSRRLGLPDLMTIGT